MTELEPSPVAGRSPRRLGRAVAIVATPIAAFLIAIRLRAMTSGSAYESGRAIGQLIGGPVLVGAVVWGVVVLWRRRSDPSARFLDAGLLAWIALAGIYGAFASVRV